MRPTPFDLSDATIAVTGGARGIGAATAALFAAQGARVVIGDLDEELAVSTAASFGGRGLALDVRDRSSFEGFITACGEVDVLVNNAGVMPNGAFVDEDDATTRLTLDVNVHGVINGMKSVLPGMLERQRGHIVNVASLAGKFPVRGLAVYNASKFAVVGLTAATRLELEGTGVTVSAVLPSAVDTDLASGLDMRPIPKVQPDDIARAVLATVRSREAEVAVPRYVGGLATIAAITPEPVLRRMRRVLRDDRALRPDTEERLAYRSRLSAEASHVSAE